MNEQKYKKGDRVWIKKGLSQGKRDFKSGCYATIIHSYAESYGGNNFKSYNIDIDNFGIVAWYEEHELEPCYKTKFNDKLNNLIDSE